jgi:hypothetical protein
MSDFVITRDKEGNVMSSGYGINNMFLKCGLPLSSLHNDYAVPMGLVLLSTVMPSVSSNVETGSRNTVANSVYDQLLALASASPRKVHKTRRRSKSNRNKTKKNIRNE